MTPRLRGVRHWLKDGKVAAVSPLLDRQPQPWDYHPPINNFRRGWWLMLKLSWDNLFRLK
jgi:hypothetical protein